MTVIRKHKTPGGLVRVATMAIAAAAVAPMLLVLGTGTSHAACGSFKFNGFTSLNLNTGGGLQANFTSFDDRVPPTVGLINSGLASATSSGGVFGRTISIDVTVPGDATVNYRGDVNDSGVVVNGTATITQAGQAPFTNSWSSTGAPLVCSEAPKQINVSWQEFIGGIKATVSMSNNKGQVGCTYSTQGLEQFDRRFTLTDDKPTDVTISPAVPLFRVWPVTITCDNGVKLETERFY